MTKEKGELINYCITCSRNTVYARLRVGVLLASFEVAAHDLFPFGFLTFPVPRPGIFQTSLAAWQKKNKSAGIATDFPFFLFLGGLFIFPMAA